jgi:hypothetical protein
MNDIVGFLKTKFVIQSTIMTPPEGNVVEMVMKRKAVGSQFLMLELIPADQFKKELNAAAVEHLDTVDRVANGACRRGSATADNNGIPFSHVIPPETKVCVWCGFGAKTGSVEVIPETREETIPCAEHGAHKIAVRQDGSYDKPDCELFTSGAQAQRIDEP